MNKQEKREYKKEWRGLNKDNIREYNYKWKKENREKVRISKKKWAIKNPEKMRQMTKRKHLKSYFGSVERYNEAMLKYEGECAFACDKQAELVHHIDGKAVHNSLKEEVNNELNNLLPLCNSCHIWLHKRKV